MVSEDPGNWLQWENHALDVINGKWGSGPRALMGKPRARRLAHRLINNEVKQSQIIIFVKLPGAVFFMKSVRVRSLCSADFKEVFFEIDQAVRFEGGEFARQGAPVDTQVFGELGAAQRDFDHCASLALGLH